MNEYNHIILFDGVCNLCNGFVQFIIKRDKKNIFEFSSLQSNYGQQMLAANKLHHNNFTSFIYLRNQKMLQKSTAALYAFKDLGGAYSVLFAFIIIPKFIRDWAYDIIATNRYKWFGKKEECWLPNEELNSKFL